jgi:hypothetical protein
MTPLGLLAAVLGVTAVSYTVQVRLRRRSGRGLRRLAAEWGMNFSRTDLLRLTAKVARHFPVPGAANLRVSNVIYGTDKDRHHYVFTAEYTAGVIRAKRRLARAGAFSEPRDREHGAPPAAVLLAPAGLPLLEQYRRLGPGTQAGAEEVAGGPSPIEGSGDPGPKDRA